MAKERCSQRVACALLASACLHVAAGELLARGVAAGLGGAADTVSDAQAHALTVHLAHADVAIPTAPRIPRSGPRDAAGTATAVTAPHEVARASPPLPAAHALVTLPTPYYYPSSELDRRPRPITAIALDEPSGETSEGYVILRLLISEAGIVDETIVVVNDARAGLVRNARDAFSRARYAPGIKDGRAVKSQMMIEVKLNGERA